VGAAIGSVLTFAVGVAVSPVPIIAVILMLFSARARVNGPAFLLGWVLALAVVSGVVYVLADSGDVGTSSSATDAVAWGKLVLGVLLLAGAARRWRTRPAPGEEAPMPKWMAGIDSMAPGRAFVLGLLLAGVNPKNLILTIGAATSLAQVVPTTTDAVVALVVFVLVASLTILLPVVYALVGGAGARAKLDGAKAWLGANDAAVMAVLLLVFGVDLVAKALPPLW
jgi:threonine/homoserine/homoserine lactone efflux protein